MLPEYSLPFAFRHRRVVPTSSPAEFFGSTNVGRPAGCHPVTIGDAIFTVTGDCPASVVAGPMGHGCPH
jgi:hypothetical protein